MKRKKTTIKDIANALNLTPSAVSKALNDHPRISKATKKAVKETAEKLNYQRNKLASALRKGQSMLVGVIIPAANINFFASVVKGIEDVLNQEGYQVIISQSYDDYEKEQKNVRALLNSQVDAVFASIGNKTIRYEHLARVKDQGIPLILFDRITDQLEVSSVVINDYQGSCRAVQHLIDQGCQRIAHIAGFKTVSVYGERIKGYRDTLLKNTFPVSDAQIIQCGLTVQDGKRVMEKLLLSPNPPDAVFVSSDYAAYGAMQFAFEQNLNVPNDLAIVGFSNDPFSSMIIPGLSTVDQHSEEMGKQAANLFLKQIKSPKLLPPEKIVLPADLIVRPSSMRKTNQKQPK